MYRTLPYLILLLALATATGARAAVPPGTEQRAYLNNSCIVSDEPYYLAVEDESQIARALSLSGLVVGKLVNAFVSGAVKVGAGGLDAISKHKDMHYLAANNVNLYNATLATSPGYVVNNQLACATVVVADFAEDNKSCVDEYVPRELPEDISVLDDFDERTKRDDETVENILRRANICVKNRARAVYEIRFSLSEDRTAYRLESAGIWVNGLLSTNSEKAKRSLIYTLDILQPASDTGSKVLSTAYINIGEVYPGLVSNGPENQRQSDWLQVPPMSRSAKSAYDRDTSVHSDVYAEIEALGRAVVRNRRMLDGINSRIETASENVQASLRSEADKVEFKMLQAESMLDAKKSEYADLPQAELHYMPVTIRLGIIESRSEKRALNALASVLKGNSSRIADSTTDRLGYSRSLEIPAMSPLDQSRTDYYDALVAASMTEDDNMASAQQDLQAARETYNAARADAGIPAIE